MPQPTSHILNNLPRKFARAEGVFLVSARNVLQRRRAHGPSTDRHRRVPQPRRTGGPCGPAGRQGQAREEQACEDREERVGHQSGVRQERGQEVQGGAARSDVEAFETKYGTNHEQGERLRQVRLGLQGQEGQGQGGEGRERRRGRDGGRGECRRRSARRSAASIGAEAFKNKYGTNHNKANAFGKCVSKLAKAQTS